jgi:hypothetical protein
MRVNLVDILAVVGFIVALAGLYLWLGLGASMAAGGVVVMLFAVRLAGKGAA